ncbi:MAG: ATP-binding cassette domain-containing protein [Halobacteriaceae archaeon]
MDPLQARNLQKRFGPVVALDGVDLAFEPGGLYCLAGPNGSGKTTFLQLVAGLTRPTDGDLQVPDVTVGYAFQQPRIYPDLTVAQNLEVFTDLLDADPAWGNRLIDALRLRPALHRRGRALSDGFGKKLDLALGLLAEPQVLLLDEPLADLDEASERQLLSLLESYADGDRVVIVSTHNIAPFGAHVDRLTILLDGRVVRDRPTPDLDGAGVRRLYLDAIRAPDGGA